jgi:hypothetical protein
MSLSKNVANCGGPPIVTGTSFVKLQDSGNYPDWFTFSGNKAGRVNANPDPNGDVLWADGHSTVELSGTRVTSNGDPVRAARAGFTFDSPMRHSTSMV